MLPFYPTCSKHLFVLSSVICIVIYRKHMTRYHKWTQNFNILYTQHWLFCNHSNFVNKCSLTCPKVEKPYKSFMSAWAYETPIYTCLVRLLIATKNLYLSGIMWFSVPPRTTKRHVLKIYRIACSHHDNRFRFKNQHIVEVLNHRLDYLIRLELIKPWHMS